MALPGEVNGGKPSKECICGTILPLRVCKSGAGYYLGYVCGNCGPAGRETNYFKSRELAEAYFRSLLEDNNKMFLRRV